MSNMMLGYQNAVPSATLTPSATTAGLGADQLQNDQGSPATAWQCPGTSAALVVDTGNPAATWRALCLAGTNLTSAATVDWRIGTTDAMQLPARGLGTQYTGPSTTYNGLTTNESGLAGGGHQYTNGPTPGNQFVYADCSMAAGTTYTLVAFFRRVSGSTVTGNAMWIEFVTTTGGHYGYGGFYPMSAVSAGTAWQTLTLTATAPITGTFRAAFGIDTGDGTSFSYAVGSTAVYATVAYDSGFVSGVVPGFRQLVIVAPSVVTGQACRLDISDPTNPDGSINIPNIYAGPTKQPSVNFDGNSAPSRTSQSTNAASRAGGVTTRTDWTKRVFDLSLSSLKSSEVPAFEDAAQFGLGGGNVLFIPDPTGSRINRDAILGQLAPTSGFGFPQQVLASRGFRATITERL